MKLKPKPLAEQVLVITGATSGIGLATARLAAERGARVVLAARDEGELREAAQRVREAGGDGGGRVADAVADVAEPDDVREIVETAERAFGGFDSWINNAGVSIYGEIEQVPREDARRLFDTNYWGVVNGSLAAVPTLRRRGGVLVNVGSVLSDRAIPLQGHYCASKHAVKGFTEALRMELEKDGAPVAVVLVKPSAIDTPYTEHARNLMDVEPTNPAPVYAPEVVAHAILDCCERPQRDVVVGAGGPLVGGFGTVAPRLADRYMELALPGQQRSDRLVRPGRRDALHAPMGGPVREDGDYPGHVRGSSAYTAARRRPLPTLLGVAALGLGVAYAVVRGR